MKPIRIILDFEASSVKNGYPVEVGIAQTFEDGRIISGAKLIFHQPWLENGIWRDAAQKVHGITKEEIRANGVSALVAARWLNSEIGEQTAYSDSDLDQGWLAQLFDVAGIPPSFRLGHVREILNSVNDACAADAMQEPSHRAEADAVQISRMFLHCIRPDPV